MKKTKNLSRYERQTIYLMRARGESIRSISKVLKRAPSTISRELRRNRGSSVNWIRLSGYEQANEAHLRSKRRASISHQGARSSLKLVKIREHVAEQLKEYRTSPELIALELPQFFSNVSVSGKTIRRWIKAQCPQLVECLRERGKKRRSRVVTRRNTKKAAPPKISIHERDESVDLHTEMGHYEIDLIVCSQSKVNILSIRELKTRFLKLYRCPNRKAETINGKLAAFFVQLPESMLKTVTEDNGAEFEHTYKLKNSFDVEFYNCDPYCSWQKGSVENANRLVREYLPKGTDLSITTQAWLDDIAYRINNRAMKCLGVRRPIDCFENEKLFALAA